MEDCGRCAKVGNELSLEIRMYIQQQCFWCYRRLRGYEILLMTINQFATLIEIPKPGMNDLITRELREINQESPIPNHQDYIRHICKSLLIMPCIFRKDEDKIEIGLRKVSVQKRRSKKSPSQLTKIYYLPILKNEAERLGLDENSFLKAELAILPSIERGIQTGATAAALEIKVEVARTQDHSSNEYAEGDHARNQDRNDIDDFIPSELRNA